MSQAAQHYGFENIGKYERNLVAEGLITDDQLAIANISKENLGLDLGSVLIKKGFVTEDQLLKFLAKQLKIPFLDLASVQFDEELVKRIPIHMAKQHRVIPIRKKGNVIEVGMVNPFDSFAIDDLKELCRAEIEPYLINGRELEALLDKFSGDENVEADNLITIEVSSDTSGVSESETRKMAEMALGPKVVAVVNNIIARAAADKASDIHIEPTRTKVQIRYRIDGLLKEKGTLAKTMHLPVVSRIKIMAGLDIAERRVPQDGRVRIQLVGKPVDMRISTCPTQHGEKIVIRLLTKDGVKGIEGLGFSEKERKAFSDIITKSHGIFLSTGPTGSGKSTTLYAALTRLNSSDKNIISIEDPIESEVEGVNQVAVNTKTGLSFAAVLRSVLRQDPDVIMLGEIRDAETAQIAVRAAITGHMVLSTLHTNTAAGCVSRLIDLGVEPFMLASALKGVMAQRLVRRICEKCREEIKFDASQYNAEVKAHLKHAFQGKGCEACHYSGFKGRVGIFELAPITEDIAKLVAKGVDDVDVVKAFRANGIKSIVVDGIEKVNAGITTIEEVFRVTNDE